MLIKQRLVILGTLYAQDVDTLAPLWIQRCRALTPAQLAFAFDRIEETFKPTSACPFPTPAHLFEHISVKSENVSHITAEHCWQKVLECRSRSSIYRQRPLHTFDEREQFAIRAAGGMHFLCTTDDGLEWPKKHFFEAWEKWEAVPESERPELPMGEIRLRLDETARTLAADFEDR